MAIDGVESEIGQASDPPVRGDAITEVQKLLEAELSQPQETAEPTESQAEKPAAEAGESWDLKSVAERLQVDPAKLYDLKLKASDGAELTVGQLKDAYKASTELDSIKATLTKARGEFEADQIRQARELDEILQAIPHQAIRPELMQVYQRQKADYLSREREALLRAIPEWSDPAVITAEQKQLRDYLAEDGWPEGALDRVEDHRLFRTLRRALKDSLELKALKAAKAEAEKPKPKVAARPQPAREPTSGQRFGAIKGAVTSGRLSPVAAVEKILSGDAGGSAAPRTSLRR